MEYQSKLMRPDRSSDFKGIVVIRVNSIQDDESLEPSVIPLRFARIMGNRCKY